MKTGLHRPLMRMATAHSAVMGNTKPSQSYSTTGPLLSSNRSTQVPFSPPPSTSHDDTMPVLCNPTFNGIKNIYSTSYSRTRSPFPLGTLAILGGMMLFLGNNSTAEAFNLPFSNRNTPASRMKERLEKHGFTERVVAPDGNCQMRSLADQIKGDEKYHVDVRSKIMSWLSKNEKFPVDDSGSTTLGDFIDRDTYPRWNSYVSYMSRDGSWGDHITLVAASEVYNVEIAIISNVDDHGTGHYTTNIMPRSKKPTKTVNLSHWHEMHYNSLHPIAKRPDREL